MSVIFPIQCLLNWGGQFTGIFQSGPLTKRDPTVSCNVLKQCCDCVNQKYPWVSSIGSEIKRNIVNPTWKMPYNVYLLSHWKIQRSTPKAAETCLLHAAHREQDLVGHQLGGCRWLDSGHPWEACVPVWRWHEARVSRISIELESEINFTFQFSIGVFN